MLEIKPSERIAQFFASESEKPGFWDALRESGDMEPDYEYWADGDHYDEFDHGVTLACQAIEAKKPVFTYTTEDGDNILYWIGTEDEILEKLQGGWDWWRNKYPQKTPEEKAASRRKKRREEVEQTIQMLQAELETLDE